MKQHLTFFQTFNAMRIFLNMYYDKTLSDKIGTMAGALNLWKNQPDWQTNPKTFDPTAWQDWLKAINITLHDDHNIKTRPQTFIFDDVIAFLCMKNYFQIFYNQTQWKDVETLLNNVKQAQYIDSDQTWQDWLKAVDHAINETYELDIYFDPFTGEQM